MTKKIVLACMLGLICVGMQGCLLTDLINIIFNGGCGVYSCCYNGTYGTRFVAHYYDGSIAIGVVGPDGHGRYPFHPAGSRGCANWIEIGTNFGFFLTANPSGADLNTPPSSTTISGQGMDGTYGMPTIEYFDGSGFFIGSVTATSVAGDGSWLTAPLPDLSQAYSGNYQLKVVNMRSSGYYLDTVGTTTLSCWGRDRPDSDGDGYYDDEDCYPYDPTLWCGGGDGGGGGGGGCFAGGECQMY